MPAPHKLSQKMEKGIPPNSFYEACNTLISKADKTL